MFPLFLAIIRDIYTHKKVIRERAITTKGFEGSGLVDNPDGPAM